MEFYWLQLLFQVVWMFMNVYKGLKTLGLKVLKIEAVCSVGAVAANADCQTGNELKNYYWNSDGRHENVPKLRHSWLWNSDGGHHGHPPPSPPKRASWISIRLIKFFWPWIEKRQRLVLMRKKVITRLCEEPGSGKSTCFGPRNSKIVYQNSTLSTIPTFNMTKVNRYDNQGKISRTS